MIRRRVLLGALLGALFALGWWVGGGRAASGLYSGLDLFVEVLQAVQTNYVDAVDTGKLMAGAMRGVAHGLDPWSRYLDPDEAKAARAAGPGAFDGIGAAVDVRGGWPVVIAPVEGSPAQSTRRRDADESRSKDHAAEQSAPFADGFAEGDYRC